MRVHAAQGHLPWRRDCATCVAGGFRARQHRRIATPEGYSLSLDVLGRYRPGRDEFRKRATWCLVVYTVPILAEGDLDGQPEEPSPAAEEVGGTEPPAADPEPLVLRSDAAGSGDPAVLPAPRAEDPGEARAAPEPAEEAELPQEWEGDDGEESRSWKEGMPTKSRGSRRPGKRLRSWSRPLCVSFLS